MKRLGIDVGGTFTDLVFVDEGSGRITVDKVPSTPDDPSRAVVSGVRSVCGKAGREIAEIDYLLHGTTVATNIALEHAGAELGMITTKGFRDVLHIARHKKPFNFSLQQGLPWQERPLVKRRNRLVVEERVVAPTGEVTEPLNEQEVREQVLLLKERGIETIVVCLLHSYLNDTHERRIKEIILEEMPSAFVSLSSEVLPLYREFERFSTTALNAYVGPRTSNYLERLETSLREAGFRNSVQLMQSSGGMLSVESACVRPVNLMMSGPVGGLIGGIWAGRMAGYDNVFTLDIGGTSADIAVSANGELRMRHLLDTKVGDYQAMIPMVDIDTIGHGGGSIIFTDEGGVFRVGPQSAGAYPGPACYGRGGTKPTSTDAQVILGRLRTDKGLIGGEMLLDMDRAVEAMKPVAESQGMSIEEASLGALQIQKFGMIQAIELNSVRRGYDPRNFTLVACGGAGPLFGCDIALEMNIPRVLVPPHPGILSATGLLATNIKHEFVATERQPLAKLDAEHLRGRYQALEREASERLLADEVRPQDAMIRRLADCRYSGQGYEVRFEIPAGDFDQAWVDAATEAFHQAHEKEYGHRFNAAIEIINIRVEGIGLIPDLNWPEVPVGSADASDALILEREVVFAQAGRPLKCQTPFYDRERLLANNVIEGPAIIEQYDSTTVIPPDCRVTVDRFGNLLVDCGIEQKGRSASEELATPILMRVIGGAFQAIAKEMAGVLYRMSYSSIIRESEDLGAGIFDRTGRQIADSDSTPMFMAAMPRIVKNVISILGDEIHEGDIILHNDPYAGATHSPDCCIVIPIFLDGELIAFAGASAHLLDTGGSTPGINIGAVDVFAEGKIYRALKLQKQGVRQDDMWRHVLENVRTPTHNEGDLLAMVAACELARDRYQALVGEYGIEQVEGAASYWMDYSERMLRAEIRKIPDGVYRTDPGYLDDDGVNRGKKLPVVVTVTIEDDEITFDLTGSSDEVPTSYNVPFEGTTYGSMAFITRMLFLDEYAYPIFVPQNDGMTRPVKVIAPKGSIFNPNFPRSCFARFCQPQRAVDLALRALAPVMPGKITAGNSAHLGFISFSGWDSEKGEYWVYLEVDEGSYGGRPGRDGMDSVDCLIANTRNNPIEELEWTYPIRTERYELRDESCAAGRWRGGVGMVRVNRVLVDAVVTCEGDRAESDPPWGIFGGHDGLNARTRKNPGMPDEQLWPAKFEGKRLSAGDTIEITVPSSGGYGDPLERDPDKVLQDVLDEFTTREAAAEDYGVVIDTQMQIDTAATETLRSDRKRTREVQDGGSPGSLLHAEH